MSALGIVLIALGALILLLIAAGYLGAARRDRALAGERARRIADADRALEHARAADRGWDRVMLEQAARAAVTEARPGFSCERLELVLVDDRPGTDEDRAQLVAVGPEGELTVVLARRGDRWTAESVA
jgi:hypothetical protein